MTRYLVALFRVWFCVLLGLVSSTSSQSQLEYGCVVDAGSSSSRIRIYSWSRRMMSSESPRDVEEISSLKVKPGIASYVSDKDGLQQHLEQLIAHGKEQVPESLQSTTPIFFMATGGMRLLIESNSDVLIENIREILSQTTINPFYFTGQNARILSGEEEGAFAWVSVNYLRGALNQSGLEPVGILELGGASTQIAFLHDEASILANKYPVRLGSRMYNLYSHSYLYYGIDYTYKWIHEWLYRQDPGKEVYYDPCMLRDDSKNEVVYNQTVLIQGSGNFTKCDEIIDEFVYKFSTKCWPKPCGIGTVYQPTISSDMEFYALSAFIFGAKHLQVRDENNKYSPILLKDSAASFCGMSMDEGMKFAEESNPDFASTYCLQGVYGYKLFVKGYGLSPTAKHITADFDINGKSPEWSLGALLTEISKCGVLK